MSVGKKIATVLLVLIFLAGSLLYDAFYAAPSRYTVRYESLNSVFIPAQMDDVSILYFSDLDFNHFMNSDRMEKLVSKINSLSPDIIIFGGDLFDQETYPITDSVIAELTDYLKQLNAPLGKFAVLGDFDYITDETENTVKSIFFKSDFEILQNQSALIRNNGSDSITIIGIENIVNSSPDITASFTNVSRSSYTIAVCHTPDVASQVPNDLVNYFIAGHSHGGQAYYGLNTIYAPEGATEFFSGKHNINDYFTLDISNGVGTTVKDVRFIANAEIVLYRLKHAVITE